MKKITLSVFAVLGINMAIAQSTTGDNTTTNGTSTGHKLENRKDTTYIPATAGDGSEKHDNVDRSGKTTTTSTTTTNTDRTKTKPKTTSAGGPAAPKNATGTN